MSADLETQLERFEAAPHEAPLALVRALFQAVAAASKDAWCIDDRAGALTEQLLRRGGLDEVDLYAAGIAQSFDAAMGCRFECGPELAAELVRRADLCLARGGDRELLERARQVFEGWR